jgi:hypothetical protein
MDVESGKISKNPVRVSLEALNSIDPDTFNWNAYTGTYKGACRAR